MPRPMFTQDAPEHPRESVMPKGNYSEIQDSEQYKKAVEEFNKPWASGPTDTVIKSNAPEMRQIRLLLEAHLNKVFRGSYTVGFFLGTDMGEKRSIGYQPLTIGMFPRDERNNPTWSDSIALSFKLQNHADGTVRWGRRNELIVCAIRNDFREKEQQRQRDAAADVMSRHVKKEKIDEKDSPEGMASEVDITKETDAQFRRANK